MFQELERERVERKVGLLIQVAGWQSGCWMMLRIGVPIRVRYSLFD